MANITGNKIQIKKADNTFLFPRVRTQDLVTSLTDAAIFTGDKLKIAHLPTTSTIRAAATATDDYVPTEAAVRSAISSIEAGLAGTVNSVTGEGPVWADPTSGAVVVGISATTGDGITKGYVITKQVDSSALNSSLAACGLTVDDNSTGSTTLVPTWNTFYGVTSMLQLMIDNAGQVKSVTGGTGISCNPTAGAVVVSNTGVLSVKGTGPITPVAATSGAVSVGIAYATTAESGAVRLATSANLTKTESAASDYVVGVQTLNRYRGAINIKSDYSALAALNVLPTGVVDGDIVLVKSGGNVGYYAASGTVLVKINPVTGEDAVNTNTGIGYNPSTGIAYVKNGEEEYIPLVRSATGDLIKVDNAGNVYLTDSAVTLIQAGGNVAGKIGSTAVTATNGLLHTYGTGTVVISGRDVANLASLPDEPTADDKKTIKGVVETINDITSTGISAVSAAAIAKGIHTAANWDTALSNNIVPTVHAITAACLFYSEI